MSEDMANRDVVEHGFIEVLNYLEGQVSDYLLDERGGVHHGWVAIGSNELPFAYNGD